MKKKIKIFLLVVGIFAFNGCNSKKVVTDVSSLVYLDNSNEENIAYNLKMAADNIRSASFVVTLVLDGKQYGFSGELIINDCLENSLMHINFNGSDLYLKKGNLYLSYMYNNTNVIVKDSVENLTNEVIKILKEKGISVNEENVYEILNNKWIDDINFKKISELVEIENDGYSIDYKYLKVHLSEKYLPNTIEYNKENISLNVQIKYNPTKISVPLGYDMVNVSIKSIKNLFRVESLAELINIK